MGEFWKHFEYGPVTDVTEFDFHGQENDCIIEHMKRLAALFVKTLNESGYFEQLEGRIPYRVLYDTFDKNVTGIVISPTTIIDNDNE